MKWIEPEDYWKRGGVVGTFRKSKSVTFYTCFPTNLESRGYLKPTEVLNSLLNFLGSIVSYSGCGKNTIRK